MIKRTGLFHKASTQTEEKLSPEIKELRNKTAQKVVEIKELIGYVVERVRKLEEVYLPKFEQKDSQGSEYYNDARMVMGCYKLYTFDIMISQAWLTSKLKACASDVFAETDDAMNMMSKTAEFKKCSEEFLSAILPENIACMDGEARVETFNEYVKRCEAMTGVVEEQAALKEQQMVFENTTKCCVIL